MKKSLIVIIIILIVALLTFWKFSGSAIQMDDAVAGQGQPEEVITGSFPALDDSTGSINKDADSISIDEFGADLESLDGDIDSF